VHEDVKEEFVEKLKEVTREFYGEDPKESKDFARIISTNHVKRLSSYLDEVRGRDDVTILNDKGGEVEESERYVAPTLVLCEGNWIKKGTFPS
jgi:aldehyde dehydrogenase (NAD+)